MTATLGGTPATGSVSLTRGRPADGGGPDARLGPAADVISLFSDAYPNLPVDTWSATWDQADVADVQIAGNAAKKYTNLAFAGIEFTSQPVNASAMTHLHIDLWTQDDAQFKVKLVDFGANGAFGGGDDSEHEITLSRTSVAAAEQAGRGAASTFRCPRSPA